MHFLSSKILRAVAVLAFAFAVMLAARQTATAQTETVLYTFSQADGYWPMAGLTMDKKDNLYGTTYSGGANLSGTVFEVTAAGTETALYSFCSQLSDGLCLDGWAPTAGLIMDKKGNLYGTTNEGGTSQWNGIVFEVSPPAKKGGAWTEKTLYNFCSQTDCADGGNPALASLIMDTEGNLYGTTPFGGANVSYCAGQTCGTVFKLTPQGQYSVLYTFCSQTNCADGANPYATLIMDSEGNFYGTTFHGGVVQANCSYGCGYGTVFKLTPQGQETVLYSFCSQTNCADGAEPEAGLIMDKEGNLYGTTTYGGANGYGTVFELTPGGEETVLFTFNSGAGANPFGGLVMDKDENLYGATAYGGANGVGTVFVVFKGPFGEGEQFYSFGSLTDCADGSTPYSALIMDKKGNLYGTTRYGGANWGTYGCSEGGGTVFKVTP